MKFKYKRPIVEAEQYVVGAPPPLSNFASNGALVIRTSDRSYETIRLRDYVVYPAVPIDEDGEPTYPELWRREQFERTFEAE